MERKPIVPGVDVDVDAYLERIGLDEVPSVDLEGLTRLQRAHMSTVPFENLHVFHGVGVRTDVDWSLDKIVAQRRGGWCFEMNGAFASLLRALGFEVRLLGASVLLSGPNRLINHLTLDVQLDRAYLVDVGFGKSFIEPLDLNSAGPQVDPAGTFEFIPSAEGRTLTWHDEDGVPVPQYRFRRVALEQSDFDEPSHRLQSDRTLHWSQKPFATRLLDGGPDRISLLRDRLHITRAGVDEETPVSPEQWPDMLVEHFGMTLPT